MTEEKKVVHLVFFHHGSCKTYHVSDQNKWYVYEEVYVNDRRTTTHMRAVYPYTPEGRMWAIEEADRIRRERDWA